MPSRHQGVALIMVLLAMALVVMLAAGMVRQQNLWVFKAGYHQAQQQAYSIALGTETFAHRILIKDLEDDKEQGDLVDSSEELWSARAAILPLDNGGVAEVQIDGLGGRINLNDLLTPSGQVDTLTRRRLERLLAVLDIKQVSVEALIDWIDTDEQTISAAGAEDGTYLMIEPSYRAANQPFVSLSELRLIAGMTEEAYNLLQPHVVVLPVSGLGINVNTATAPVLASLHNDLTMADAEAIIDKRQEDRFEDIGEFLALPEFAGLGLNGQGLTLQTRFFDVVSRVTYDNRVTNFVSRAYRGAQGEVRTLYRSLGQKNRITKEPYTFSEG